MPFLENADVMYLPYICNNDSGLSSKISKAYLTAVNRFKSDRILYFNPTSKSGYQLLTKFKPPKKNHNLLKTGANRLYFI